MSEIIDFEKYKQLRTKDGLTSIPNEDQNEIAKEISDRYLNRLSEIQHSFSMELTELQKEQVSSAIKQVKQSYEEVVFEAVAEIAFNSAQLHIVNKYS